MLIPEKHGKKLNYKQFCEIDPEGQWELIDGEIMLSDSERMAIILTLLYNSGLEKFVSLLPQEVRNELAEILQNQFS